ncbi:MFS general substrate transporter [Xylariaceae sp. FL0804]|nr:MFS general substrate transporter [Xylariaceae sp. FL0804]
MDGGDDLDCHVPGDSVAPRYRRETGATIMPLLVLLLLVNLTTGLTNLPLNRLLETRLCRSYYDVHHDVSEDLCKVDEVQQNLARLMGAVETLWVAGDFVMTIPLSFLAEKYGRRAVLWLNMASRFFMLSWVLVVGYSGESLPPSAVIAGSALALLGAGDTLFNSLTYSLAASMTEDSVTRATYFSWMTALSSVIGFLGPAVAAATMAVRLFLPFWIGLALLVLAVPTIYLLPGLANTAEETEDEQRRPLISSPILKAQASGASFVTAIVGRLHTLLAVVKSHPRNLGLLLTTFFLTAWASSDTKLLAQYISKRYQWTFVSAGYLLSCKAVVNFVILTFLVPILLRTQKTPDHSALHSASNLRYARFCLVMSVLGALAIGVSRSIWMLLPSLLLYALGVPLSVFTLGLLKSPAISPQAEDSPVSSEPEVHLFSIVMMIKTLGSLVGAPFMATMWFYGIRDAVYGSPFFASTLIYLAAVVIFSRIRVR